VEWDHFKILLQADAPSLVEIIRTLYGPNLPQKLSPDVEMVVDKPLVVEEAPFTTVTNKKGKGKKRPSLLTLLYLLRTCPHQYWWSQERLLLLSQPRWLLSSPSP